MANDRPKAPAKVPQAPANPKPGSRGYVPPPPPPNPKPSKPSGTGGGVKK